MFKFIKYFGFTLLLLTSFIKITFANDEVEKTIVGKTNNNLITIDGELIKINDILDIKKLIE